jgi:hypothetical protein
MENFGLSIRNGPKLERVYRRQPASLHQLPAKQYDAVISTPSTGDFRNYSKESVADFTDLYHAAKQMQCKDYSNRTEQSK